MAKRLTITAIASFEGIMVTYWNSSPLHISDDLQIVLYISARRN